MDRSSDSEVVFSSSGASVSPADGGDTQQNPRPARRRPIPRKGHTKSRKGCSTCKRRKVKCDEISPLCGPCHRLGLDCAYVQKVREEPASTRTTTTLPIQVVTRSLRTEPMTFNIDDMRFFQHFLFAAYPSLPIDGWSVWQYASQMSYEFDFLMHAMLGLGASHLTLISPTDYSQASLSHRVTAIKSLNEFLSTAHLSQVNADAAFATMLALTFQASHMPDGLVEYLTMARGCYLVGVHAINHNMTSIFNTFDKEFYVSKVMEGLIANKENRHLDSTIAKEFNESAKRLTPLCTSAIETEYLGLLQGIVAAAVEDPLRSHFEHTMIYDGLGELTPSEFAAFIDPQNHVARLIIIHMLAVDFIMSRRLPLGKCEMPHRVGLHVSFDFAKVTSLVWIEDVMSTLPEEYVPYGLWTLKFMRTFMSTTKTDEALWKRSVVPKPPFVDLPGFLNSEDRVQFSRRGLSVCRMPRRLAWDVDEGSTGWWKDGVDEADEMVDDDWYEEDIDSHELMTAAWFLDE